MVDQLSNFASEVTRVALEGEEHLMMVFDDPRF